MSHFKKLTFLKVLATIAWADGEVTNSEINIIKSFYRKFDLDHDQINELKPYLAAPIPKKEQDALIRQLVAELKSPRERKEIVKDLEEMAHSGGNIKEEEKELMEEISRLINETSFTRRSFGKIRNMFQHTILKPARKRNATLDHYFKEKVLRKVDVKTRGGRGKLDLDDDQMYFICLFGSLLAAVAHVDDHFDETEKKALKSQMKEKFTFNQKEMDVLFEIIEEEAREGFDRHAVVTEFNRQVSYNDRLDTVNCFFAIATADGDISHDEMEEIRGITKAMRVPHQDYIKSKLKFLNILRSGNG